jgi:hypothetical protein
VQFIDPCAFSNAAFLSSVTYECSSTPLSVGADAFSSTPYAANGLAVPATSCRIIDFAFDCSDVQDGNLHIIKSRKSVSKSNFLGCILLTSVTYDADSQLESIGPNAFLGSSLVSVRIPASVQLISGGAFADLSLQTVTYDCSDQPLFISKGAFQGTPYEANGLAMPAASCRKIEYALDATSVHDGHLIVPAATTRIDSHSFENVAITSATFEQGSRLKVIADQAFRGSFLTSIDIPMSVESIEDGAFSGSFALSSMTFSCSSHSLTIAANAFDGTALTSIALPLKALYEGVRRQDGRRSYTVPIGTHF